MRNLLIVESAGKIKKLRSILGSDWDVKASIGHIRQLANDGDGALGFDLGTDTIDCRYIPRDDRAKQTIDCPSFSTTRKNRCTGSGKPSSSFES
jgi:DNA topoisomerase I